MINVKTKEEISILREGGKRLARILQNVGKAVKPGVSTAALNDLAEKLARDGGDEPSLLGYRPRGAKRPYPAAICISINDEVVHGIPNEDPKIVQEGDLVKLDMCLTHNGLITDATITVPAGKISEEAKELLDASRDALYAGIKAARAGKYTGDIGYAIEKSALSAGFPVVEELCGHGVGYKVHEDPYVPNYGEKGMGDKLKAGMVLALEPMLNAGLRDVYLAKDGYTYKTKDGTLSAHFEHTVVITKSGAEILTLAD